MSRNIAPQSAWTNPLHFITFGFGSGTMPYAPGTFGTLACIPFYLLFQGMIWWQYLIVTIIVALIGIYLCGRTCKEIGVHDHPGTVFDEFVGFFVTMLFAPVGWVWIVVGFVLFRFFDICKPWPIKWLDQNIHGGLGVVLDDIVAGVFAMVIMQIIAIPFQ